MLTPSHFKPRHVVTGKKFRWLLELIQQFRIITDAESGLASEQTPSGTKLWLDEPREFPIRITEVDMGKFAWNAVKATTGGGWMDLDRPSGTISSDWAVETNGGTAAVPQIVLARREEWTHRLTFERDNCS